ITGGAALTGKGLLFGFGSGIGYALYTIFSRYALQRGYSSSTINLYSCVLASLGALLIWGPGDTFRILVSTPSVIPWSIGLGGLCCFVPYMLYTYGLTGTENGKASVLASIEPVVASLVGVFFYHETMTIPTLIGVLLVLSAVVLLNLSGKSRAKRQ
ncbi:MAG: DMT family transporter, partial [Clostridia bacterium]|nr:DMT family transporter [Clostridia bacterium]